MYLPSYKLKEYVLTNSWKKKVPWGNLKLTEEKQFPKTIQYKISLMDVHVYIWVEVTVYLFLFHLSKNLQNGENV